MECHNCGTALGKIYQAGTVRPVYLCSNDCPSAKALPPVGCQCEDCRRHGRSALPAALHPNAPRDRIAERLAEVDPTPLELQMARDDLLALREELADD